MPFYIGSGLTSFTTVVERYKVFGLRNKLCGEFLLPPMLRRANEGELNSTIFIFPEPVRVGIGSYGPIVGNRMQQMIREGCDIEGK